MHEVDVHHNMSQKTGYGLVVEGGGWQRYQFGARKTNACKISINPLILNKENCFFSDD
jgi:hypothetical protein